MEIELRTSHFGTTKEHCEQTPYPTDILTKLLLKTPIAEWIHPASPSAVLKYPLSSAHTHKHASHQIAIQIPESQRICKNMLKLKLFPRSGPWWRLWDDLRTISESVILRAKISVQWSADYDKLIKDLEPASNGGAIYQIDKSNQYEPSQDPS